jgi:hypothetical protein
MADNAEIGQGIDPQLEQASFWEIFKHAWPILFERPKQLMIVIAAMAVASEVVDALGLILQAPYTPYFEAFGKSLENPGGEGGGALKEGLEKLGYSRLLLSGLLPCLAAPFIWLTMCHATLSIWDGWRIGRQSILFALRRYLAGLKILAIISCFAIFLFLFSLLSLIPLLLVQGMVGRGGMAAGNWLLTMLGVGAGLFFFVKILWPHLRRFLLLHFLVYFRLADGETGPWTGRILRLYDALRACPSHMNQGVAVFLLTFLGAAFTSSIILTMLTMAGAPAFAANLAGSAVIFAFLLWPFTALAGFYRLIISPAEPSSGAAAANGAIADEPFPPMRPGS